MLWVLKRTVSMHPKHMLKLMGKKINAILGAHTILIWTYGYPQKILIIDIYFRGDNSQQISIRNICQLNPELSQKSSQ